MVFWARILYYRVRKISPAACPVGCGRNLHHLFRGGTRNDEAYFRWKQELSGGAHAARLAALYCCAPEQTPAQAARYEAVLDGL